MTAVKSTEVIGISNVAKEWNCGAIDPGLVGSGDQTCAGDQSFSWRQYSVVKSLEKEPGQWKSMVGCWSTLV